MDVNSFLGDNPVSVVPAVGPQSSPDQAPMSYVKSVNESSRGVRGYRQAGT